MLMNQMQSTGNSAKVVCNDYAVGVETDVSPVEQVLNQIALAVESANMNMSGLICRLVPVSAEAAVGAGEPKPGTILPSQMEQRLSIVLEEVERLNRRIVNARNELRI